MTTIADFADEFARQARNGEAPRVKVAEEHAEVFLGALAREGFTLARLCLAEITDPELRRIVETVFFSTVAGAAAGAAIGGAVAGPPGAKVGALIGTGAGLAVGCLAVALTVRQVPGRRGPELAISVAI